MLDLVQRSDLATLNDAELVDRLDKAWEAHDSAKRRYGFEYFLYSLSWTPRQWVSDPRDYWYPSHIVSEIRDIIDEMKRRVERRKQAGT